MTNGKDISDRLPPQVTTPLFRGALALGVVLIALVGAAAFIPLATTLALSGRIVSAQPEVVLQPPYGGPVAEVLVSRHTEVAAGDVVVRLDTEVAQQQATAVRALAARLRSENTVIAALLARQGAGAGGDSEHALKMQMAEADSRAKRQSVTSLERQIARLERKTILTQEQLAVMQARATRQGELLQKGVARRTEVEALEEQVLMVAAEVEGYYGDLAALRDRREQTAAQADMVLLQARQQLTAVRARNLKQLQDIDKQLAELGDRIRRATVRAPISGTVTRLELEARHAFAARGKTLLAIAQPLAHPHLELTVPTSYIDQLQPGMRGRLVLPSLPQRSMPRIEAQVIAISPRAALDEAGQPVSYGAQADLSPEAAHQLTTALSDMRLSEDMPVQLVLEVRTTTLAQYLLAPFMAAFQRALQD